MSCAAPDFEDWWSFPGAWVEAPNQRRSGWSGVVRVEAAGRSFYVKRQYRHLCRDLRHPFGWPTASREWRNLRRLRALGIAAPRPVFHAVRRGEDGTEAVLVTEALDGFSPLAELGAMPAAGREAIARALGDCLGRLHRARLQHGCLYAKHVMVRLASDGSPQVALLDLEKMRTRLTGRKAAERDLDQLRRHQRFFDAAEWATLIDSHARALRGASPAGPLRPPPAPAAPRYDSRDARDRPNRPETPADPRPPAAAVRLPARREGQPAVRTSLARRLFRTIFAIGLINVAITLIAVEYIYEDMEETILDLELTAERANFERQIADPTKVQSWRTAWLVALYVPDGADEPEEMPEMFAGRAPPFSAELEIGERTYLVSIERTAEPPGALYLSQDISLMEEREGVTQTVTGVLAAGMLLLGFVLARLGTRRIVGPLDELAGHIAGIRPGTPFARIGKRYEDEELAAIARTLDELLDALDAYVRREKTLVALASHELRTPVAVIAGAVDVLEQRGTLGEADRDTVARIRRATDEMRADVEALLKLARRTDDAERSAPVDLGAAVRAVVAELESSAPEQSGRIDCRCDASAPSIVADPALVRMLLRNLVQNALRHTRQAVRIDVGGSGLRIADEGQGLPEHVRARLAGDVAGEVPEDGLGLFIVRLICERLGWQLRIRRSDAGGTVLDILFPPTANGS